MDELIIKDLVVMAHHGLFPGEKELGQKFLLSLKGKYDMTEAAVSGNIKESVDYGKLSRKISEFLTLNTFDLIETCAYKTLELVFREYPVISELKVSLKKPWAPIGLPLDYAEVVCERKKRRFFISLGSNLGDREENLNNALKMLERESIEIKKASSYYETKPWGNTEQPDFLNACCEIISYEEPRSLLKILQEIEGDLGRVRKEKWGARTIDLDILFVDSEIIYSEDLIIPHPYICERKFVLEPLNEIAPFFIHPVYGKEIRELIKNIG